MFSYYGSKSKLVHLYPPPMFDTIVEPFAGSARYALRHGTRADRKVILCDLDPTIAGIWHYLIHEATPERIAALPQLNVGDRLSDIPCLTKEEADLIGFSVEIGKSRPHAGAVRGRAMVTGSRKTYDRWETTRRKILERIGDGPWVTERERDLLGMAAREGIASPSKVVTARSVRSQLPKDHPKYANKVSGLASLRPRILKNLETIKHWKILNKSYADLPDVEATWFVDPPYQGPAGRGYKFNQIDYAALAEWCRTRRGQVIVCEGAGGNWLPFRRLATNANGSVRSLSCEQWWSNYRPATLFERIAGARE